MQIEFVFEHYITTHDLIAPKFNVKPASQFDRYNEPYNQPLLASILAESLHLRRQKS